MPARPLTKLELEAAYSNGIEMLTDNNLIEELEAGDVQGISSTWTKEFPNVHTRLFQSRSFNHDDEKPGIIWRSRARTVSPLLTTLVKQLYNEDGSAKRPSRKMIASYLADAYTALSNLNPFEYGEDLTLRTFFALIGKTKALTDDQGTKLDVDFTRLNNDDLKKLNVIPDEKTREAVDAVFEKLLDPAHNITHQPLPFSKRWNSLPKSEIEIVQKHFLSHTYRHRECLVTINGGLVPLDAVEGDIIQHINRGGHPADFTVPRDKIIDYLIKDGREEANSIDGIPIKDDAVPLMALNIDLLTGLDVSTQLDSVKRYCQHHHSTHILCLPEYVKAHELPDNMKNRLERAAQRVETTREIVWASINKAFEGKKPVNGSAPKIFMTMGGTGSGKSNLAAIASKETDGNFVEASLDAARTNFQIYDLYAAVGHDLSGESHIRTDGKPVRTGHHFGDYIALETAAGYIREGVVERAKGYQENFSPTPRNLHNQDKQKRYNLLYDGSGVPYKGKYEKIIEKLGTEGFKTYILVADAPIKTSYERATSRLKGPNGRAVPPKVIVDKHRRLPTAIGDALVDEYVRNFEIIDTTADGKETYYTLAKRTDDLLPVDLQKLEKARKEMSTNPRALYAALKEADLLPENVRHAPAGWEERVEFMVVSHNHHNNRTSNVLIITDADRMAAIIKKSALNPDASGLDDLHTLHQPFETIPGKHGAMGR